MGEPQVPRIGVGIIITKNSKVLFGYRKSAHGQATWCPPGGKLEYGESPLECAVRETKEEAGIGIKDCRIVGVTNDLFDDGQHFVTIWIQATWQEGEPQVQEPEKMIKWQWAEWDKLPQPLFLTIKNLINTGYKP
jgi:8-oxo-dGTP diphosphatase